MRTSPLLLTLFVAIGLLLVGVPVWNLTRARVVSARPNTAAEEMSKSADTEERDFVVWVSHIPAEVTLITADETATKVRIGEDELQEAYVTLDVPKNAHRLNIVARVEHESNDFVESAISVTANLDANESLTEFFRFSGFGEQELSFDWGHEAHDHAH